MNCPKTNFKKTAWSAAWGGTTVVALVMCSLLLLNSTAAYAGNRNGRVAKDLNYADSDNTSVDVIVQYKTTPNSKQFGRARGRGARVKHDLSLMNAAAYSMPANQVANLADDDSDIAYVSPDRVVRNTGDDTDAFVAVNTDVAQSYGYDGTGIGVAVIDSGINTNHSDLNRRVVYSQDFTGQGTTDDLYGHGTHVAGIIAGSGSKSHCQSCFLTYEGVAQSVKLINLRVLDNTGSGSDSAVIKAIQTAINLKSQYNIRVINLSLGRGIYESYQTDPLTQAVEQAWKAGIFVVV
ncbi:MAG: S8 family serine peptidase, partial [Acidobacteriia bacterium]|nr:S8 family serine peptidase [Terriglobia bacterium]